MANYTVDGKNYKANDGFMFRSLKSGMLVKAFRMSKNASIDDYEIVPEVKEPDQPTSTYEVVSNEQALTELMEVINDV